VRFLVTSDPLGERALYENTLLSELHTADPRVALGDTVMLGGLAFEKQFSNPSYVRRNGALSRAYTDTDNSLPFPTQPDPNAPQPLWNSVYKVLGEESAVVAARSEAIALLDSNIDPVIPEDMLTDSQSEGDEVVPQASGENNQVSDDTAAAPTEPASAVLESPGDPVPAQPDSLQ
jgi:hypothetical protein